MDHLAELVNETKQSCLDYIPRLIQACENLSDWIQEGRYWYDLFADFTEGVSWLDQAVRGIQVVNPGDLQSIEGADLQRILRQAEQALENEDLVSLADLFRYELKPLLERYYAALEGSIGRHVS